MTIESFNPEEKNLGKNCRYWDIGSVALTCAFPKVQLEGRRSCEGIIDDVCLFVKDGRPAKSLTLVQIIDIKFRMPDSDKSYLPPGDVV
ncbi:hypothetical protein H7X68_01430 [Candidatus Saccharibacteria bacterium]|nr:hypothetical protein [Candidatus Saccharibacteria bacterium]